ncbi:GumC family protein [Pararhizobium arenae]|uniref:GumC family protein n=1 Tax=Pararhizobium arenae TaxID=1856850 RepID=UPI00094AF6EA|nr:GumC family protein [Pararhizobium arenae]
MFEPDNKGRRAANSLLDFAPNAPLEKARPRYEAVRLQSPDSLIDRLNALAVEKAPEKAARSSAAKIETGRSSEKPEPGLLARVKQGVSGSLASKPVAFSGSRAPAEPNPDRPLIDLALIAASVWQLRKVILATTVLGAVGGVMFAMSTPSTYVAESKLYIDPREVRLTDSDLSKESLSTEAILAIVDSQTQVLRSPSVLARVATELKLESDPEFGNAPGEESGGLVAGVKVIRDILSPADRPVPRSDVEAAVDPQVLDNLFEAISVSRDPKTFVVTVEVKSWNAEKSASIANHLVKTFLKEEESAQSSFFQRTTEALDSRLAGLRASLDEAENAVEKYKADHDIIGANGELIADRQLAALTDQVAAARSRISDAKAKGEIVKRADADAVLTGALPEEMTSVALSELRKQYSSARAQLASLEASLGPRHPQRLAAAQAVDVARTEVNNELRRIAASNQTELERAKKAEQDLLSQLAFQKTQQVTASGSFIELRELERKAAATRSIYESFLKRAGETGEEEKLTTKNIRVISPAQAPLAPSGTSRRTIAILGVMLGFMAGLGLGVMLGVVRSLRQLFSTTDVRQRTLAEEPVTPPDGDGPDGRRFREPQAEPPRYREPSYHHTAASTAALSALDAQPQAAWGSRHRTAAMEPRNVPVDPNVAHVRQELYALRSRVEDYARHKAARRR